MAQVEGIAVLRSPGEREMATLRPVGSVTAAHCVCEGWRVIVELEFYDSWGEKRVRTLIDYDGVARALRRASAAIAKWDNRKLSYSRVKYFQGGRLMVMPQRCVRCFQKIVAVSVIEGVTVCVPQPLSSDG